jgi:hypothetical protein
VLVSRVEEFPIPMADFENLIHIPFMSNFTLNVHRLLVVATATTLSYACVAAPAPMVTALKLTAAQAGTAHRVALPSLKASVEEPVDRVPTLRAATAPVWSDAGATHRAVLLVTLSYPDAQDAYCRLVTLPADLSAAQVADPTAMQDCLGIGRTLFVDVNDDGRVDVIAGLRLQSNRLDVTLEVPAVFLSDESAPAGYCYSQQASDRLQPDDLSSAPRAKASLHREQARLRLSRYACDRS